MFIHIRLRYSIHMLHVLFDSHVLCFPRLHLTYLLLRLPYAPTVLLWAWLAFVYTIYAHCRTNEDVNSSSLDNSPSRRTQCQRLGQFVHVVQYIGRHPVGSHTDKQTASRLHCYHGPRLLRARSTPLRRALIFRPYRAIHAL